MNLGRAVHLLAEQRIAFSVHFPGGDRIKVDRENPSGGSICVITITESLNNEQLKTAVELGGNLAPNGVVQILIKIEQ